MSLSPGGRVSNKGKWRQFSSLFQSIKIRDSIRSVNDTHSHQELVEIELERRALLKAVKQFSTLNILFGHFSGTVLFEVFFLSMDSWLNIIFFAICRWLIRSETYVLPMINPTIISFVGAFISFFTIFYANQMFLRFTAQYDNSMKIEGKIINICLLSKSALHQRSDVWQMMRYANAVHLLGYIGLTQSYNEQNTFSPINEIHKLLTADEVESLKEIGLESGGNCFREVISWMIDLVSTNGCTADASSSDDARTDVPIHGGVSSGGSGSDNSGGNPAALSAQLLLINEILLLRSSVTVLYFFEDQPLPFVYLHCLVLSIGLFMLLATYCIATSLFLSGSASVLSEVVGVFVLCLIIIFFVGLKTISHQLMDPYGADLNDLSVFHYVNSTILSSRRILTARKVRKNDLKSEAAMENGRPFRGKHYGGDNPELIDHTKYSTKNSCDEYKRRDVIDIKPPVNDNTFLNNSASFESRNSLVRNTTSTAIVVNIRDGSNFSPDVAKSNRVYPTAAAAAADWDIQEFNKP
eukprot:gene30492-39742_t